MFIKSIDINNYKIFDSENGFQINDFNIPDGDNIGTGINLIVGENGCGKTTLLDALSLPVLSYKMENFSIDDINNPKLKTEIKIFSSDNYNFKGTMPNSNYIGKGFLFKANLRKRINSNYLSSIISKDQLYLKADGESKPKDNTPDLRYGVDNPFSGARFNENDFIFLDKNRTNQTKGGTYNTTRFDRLMEDFNYQYIKSNQEISDINEGFSNIFSGISNDFLSEAINTFEEINNNKIILSLIDNWKPFKNGEFGVKKENNQIIKLSELGSGYEMIFSLIYSFYLSKQSGKQLIIFIDELELHLHPKIQKRFIKFLLDISKDSQIFITTHSPLLLKEFMRNDNIKIFGLKNNNENIIHINESDLRLSTLSSNEINFIAFDLPTEEYHNELYEELKSLNYEKYKIINFDINFFQKIKNEEGKYDYGDTDKNKCSIHTYLRNQIHHRGNNGIPNIDEIKKSIIKMREYLIID